MSLTIQIDDSKFRTQLARFVDELGLAAPDVVKDQTRLLLKTVIGFTMPKTLAQGRAAVARDIARSMTPINPAYFHQPRMRERVTLLALKDDLEGLRAVFSNSKSWRNWRIEPFSPSLHTSARDPRSGRVLKSQRVFIPGLYTVTRANAQTRKETLGGIGQQAKQWTKYVATVQGFVGRLKAAWGPAYEAVGGTLPAWVKRHANPRGAVKIEFGDPQRPAIEFRNGAVGVGKLIGPFRGAMQTRAKAMATDIRRRMHEAKKKAGFK